MPWKNQTGGGKSGGPWGSGNGSEGPWSGGSGRGRRGGGTGGGSQPPNFEDMIRRGQDNVRRFMPGGFGSARGVSLIAIAVILIWLATGFYQVKPEQAGVELIFGKVTNVTAQGLHWNWPSPIGDIEKPNVTVEHRTEVGYISTGTDPRSGRRSVSQESLMLTGDENIIDVQVAVFWRIDTRPVTETVGGEQVTRTPGIRNFLFNIRRPEKTVKDATESAMREIVGKNEFENIRTTGRVAVEREALAKIQSILDLYGAGIQVLRVQLQRIDPPGTVLNAFRDVQAARADKEKMINEATAYLNRIVQEAQGEAERILRAAEAFKEERIAIASGETRRFLSIYQEYKGAKDITRQRIYVETMRDVLKGMDKIIIDKNGRSGVVPYLPLNELMRRRSTTPSTDTPTPPATPPTVRPPQTSDRVGGPE